MSLKQPDGSFQMNEGGEIDVRYVYSIYIYIYILIYILFKYI